MKTFLSEDLESVFTDSDIRHIMKRRSLHEDKLDQNLISPNDFEHIPEVLQNFDSCTHSDIDKLGNKKFPPQKELSGTLYLVTIRRGNRKSEIKTMWRKKMSGASC